MQGALSAICLPPIQQVGAWAGLSAKAPAAGPMGLPRRHDDGHSSAAHRVSVPVLRGAAGTTRDHPAEVCMYLWSPNGGLAWLEEYLEREDQEADDQAKGDRPGQRPASKPGPAACHEAPEPEGGTLEKDDGLD